MLHLSHLKALIFSEAIDSFRLSYAPSARLDGSVLVNPSELHVLRCQILIFFSNIDSLTLHKIDIQNFFEIQNHRSAGLVSGAVASHSHESVRYLPYERTFAGTRLRTEVEGFKYRFFVEFS